MANPNLGLCPNMREAWQTVSTISHFGFVGLHKGLSLFLSGPSPRPFLSCWWFWPLFCVFYSPGQRIRSEVQGTISMCFRDHSYFVDGFTSHRVVLWPLFCVFCSPSQRIRSLLPSGWSLFGQGMSKGQSPCVFETIPISLIALQATGQVYLVKSFLSGPGDNILSVLIFYWWSCKPFCVLFDRFFCSQSQQKAPITDSTMHHSQWL